MDSALSTLLSILLKTGTAVGLLAASAGLLIGLWLIIAPAGYARLEERASRAFSLRRALRPLEISRNLDRHIYRHHRSLGLLIIAASSFTLYRLLFLFDPAQKGLPLFAGLLPHARYEALSEALLSALHLALILAHLSALLIGLVLYLRPSALKGFEATANRWVSSRQKSRWLDTPYNPTARLMESHPRLLGLTVLLLTLYLASLLLQP
ncbi:MAG: hypothetical protein OQK94_02065 [Gammaproteobacteria bacterium]|nr:hypothetical protein [Gammaproteobacteria bacterium]MCW8841324.1 hypothetical protein [Gammaproteobacteria bacterium]MCW8927835.1 hypothetical protein [Gammaproteobacteria bacterium]MCW8959416.1 hypothetical protein [Gammaproteobacteria bacterium]MCW8971972.1 hypothetical protein [Gammaproteobacteria bacterium]